MQERTAQPAMLISAFAILAICAVAFGAAAVGAYTSPVTAYGTMILDGLRDLAYGSPIATDATGDLANPGPGGWSGTTWTDQSKLYCENDASYLYVYADLPQYAQSTSSGQIGLLIDKGSAAGGSADPWGNAITYGHMNKPDYAIRGNIPGINNPPNDNNGWTELRTWNGSAWSAGGTNWGGLNSGGQLGSKIAYSNNNGIEFKIPLSDLGNPALGTILNLEFFATQSGSAKGAYDTTPSDDQSTGWDDATTLINYGSCTLSASGPTNTPTNTPTPGSAPTNTATPTATVAQPSSCTGAIAGDGTVLTSALYHDNTDPAYRVPTGAIQPTGSALVRLRACKNDVQQVQVLVWRTGDALAAPSFTYTAIANGGDPSHDLWEATVPGDTVNLWYQFRVTDAVTIGQFQPISGNDGPGKWYTGALQNPSWSLPVVLPTPTPPPDYAVPAWIKDAVIYQIFPDRFRNGDASNDPVDGAQVYEPNGCAGYPHARPNPGAGGCQHDLRAWTDPLLSPSWGLDFYGGDLQGVIDKINANYFNELGVNTLYFNPIFQASSNHGYDTNDYHTIRGYFGANALFDQLITVANAKGLRVILDGVFNHAGMDSKYLDPYTDWVNPPANEYGACESNASPFRSWFIEGSSGADVCAADVDASTWGWKGWYGYSTLPEFVDASPGVRDLFFRGGAAGSPGGKSVSQFWKEKGIAGWRYDVSQDISHDFFQNMRPYVKGANTSGTVYGDTEQIMLGEVTGGCDWGLYQSYINQNEFDSVMNYCFRDWAKGFGNGDPPSQFNNNYSQFRAKFPPSPWQGFMNLISSHDSPRMLNLLGNDKARLKLVTLLQFTLPGAPSVYYGDEAGVTGGGDPDNRRPFPWPDINGGVNGNGDVYDAGMRDHFKTVIGLRMTHPALRGGDVTTLLVDDPNKVYSYLRWDTNEKLVVVLNNDINGVSHAATIPVSSYIPDGTVLTDLLNPGYTVTVSGGNISVASVSALWGRILHAGQLSPPPPTATPTFTPTLSPTPATATPTSTATATPTAIGSSTPTSTPTGAATPIMPSPTTPPATGASHNCDIWWSHVAHDTFNSAYRSIVGPTTPNNTVRLRLRVAQNDITSARVRVWDDRTKTQTYLTLAWDGAFDTDSTYYDWWFADLAVNSQPTILYYFFEINDAPGTCTADQDFYVDDDPKFYGGGLGTMNDGYDDTRSFQVTVYDPTFTVPTWMQNAIVYQVFPDRFRDGNAGNNPAAGRFFYNEPGGAIVRSNTSSWNTTVCDPRGLFGSPCPDNYSQNFYGGDLAGIKQKIDEGYFDSLGVTAIYLNPIFKSPSNHKYDTADFMTVDPDFGNAADFDSLVAAATSHGIKLILDGVFNHTSSDSKYFDYYAHFDTTGGSNSGNDGSGACEAGGSSYASWYYFPATSNPACDARISSDPTVCNQPADLVTCRPPGAGGATTYEAWNGYPSLPKLQANSTPVRQLIWASGTSSVGPYWVSQGANGWRFDVGGDVDPGLTNDPANSYWEGFRNAVRAVDPQVLTLGEEWGDASAWLLGSEWDSVMNYRFRSAVLSWLFTGCSGNGCSSGTSFSDNDSNASSASGSISALSPSLFNARLLSIWEDYPPQAWKAMMNIAGSHDTNRLRFLLKKISNDNDLAGVQRMKEWHLFALTYAGAPTLYYGDEMGLSQDGVWVPGPSGTDGKWEDDPYNRAPFPWDDTPGALSADTALQAHVRKLASIRQSYAALRDGDVKHGLIIDDVNKIYGFGRTNDSQTALIALRRSDGAAPINVTFAGLNAAPYNLPDGTVLRDALNGAIYTVFGGSVTVPVNGNWGVVLIEPAKLDQPKAPVVTVSRPAGTSDVKLAWAPVTQDTGNGPEVVVGYEVHRATTPHFTPGPSTLVITVTPPAFGSASGLSYTDANKVGDPAQNYYYKVISVNAAGIRSDASNHVGEFDLGLVQGG